MADPSGRPDFDATTRRATQRREKISARLAMTANDHALASAMIEDHLARFLATRTPGVIAFCWPVRREFDCRPLVTNLLEAGWQACQPVVVAAAAPMAFRAWQPDSPMTRDRHGIPIPATGLVAAPDVILLPLVAFDEQGYRLGYGGGYFDRTLASLTPRPCAIGVGFELTRLDTVCPATHDICLDAIVTELGLREFGMGNRCGK
jgi:5-formyltetrahydrofolate cyclo-ligase